MNSSVMPSVQVERRIFLCRGRKIMLARDLAELYEVEPRLLTQAVKRNQERFPPDFIFQLNEEEIRSLRSQFVISNDQRGGNRYAFYAFTEQGIAMLSSVLKSKRAILVNIQIMRTFTRLRDLTDQNDTLRFKIETMEKQYDEQFQIVFDAIRRLSDEPVNT